MNHALKIFIFSVSLSCGNQLYAQYFVSPLHPYYSIVDQPSATLDQVLDTMYALANPDDSSEGGEMDLINEFRTFWQWRVLANDTDGTNMFQQYCSAVGTAAAEKLTGPVVPDVP